MSALRPLRNLFSTYVLLAQPVLLVRGTAPIISSRQRSAEALALRAIGGSPIALLYRYWSASAFPLRAPALHHPRQIVAQPHRGGCYAGAGRLLWANSYHQRFAGAVSCVWKAATRAAFSRMTLALLVSASPAGTPSTLTSGLDQIARRGQPSQLSW